MHAVLSEKVPGGKLVRVKIEFDSVIRAAQISGDFFLHPEESLERIEQGLLGLPATADAATIQQRIAAAMRESDAAFIGLTAEALAAVIRKALTAPEGFP